MESEEKKPIDLSQLSPEELQAELDRRNADIIAGKQRQRKAYEDLKEQTIISLCTGALTINETLKAFKLKAFEDMQTIYEMLKEYSSRHADGKGNFRIEHGKYRVSYKRQGKPTFDERSHQAEKHIIDFVNSKFENDVDTKDLVMSLLERKKGELDINLVQKLYAMEDRFQDENWKRGIELLKESYSFSHSKDYIGFEVKNDKGEWLPINLQFSNI
ncbi:DUF3164 family protein [Flavobacterium sasangense]|uniref:DUF3164 family protein n=1 Tax=Flavobacterium sasangense TaxID=503361 RepID=UPI000479F910|nr:DUF3164 family protein [Flavobacterium sasangense]